MFTELILFFKTKPGKILLFSVITLILILVAIWSIRKIITKAAERSSEDTVKKANQDVNDAIKSGQKLSYPPSAYSSYADQAYEGMRYSAVDDNDAPVVQALTRMNNDADVAKLIAAFGVRVEKFFGLQIGSAQSLFQMVSSNLSDDNLRAINNNWENKGITYRV